jgi:hypothetical protein
LLILEQGQFVPVFFNISIPRGSGRTKIMSRKSNWLKKKARKNAKRLSSRRGLGCEPLEDRRVLATLTVTSLADAGAGTLRDAIATSNTNGEDDTIMFDASVAGGTISLTTGELTIGELGQETTLVGSGETIDAGGLSRVINVNDGDGYAQSTTVSLSNLTVTGGAAPAGYAGGGIQSGEILTVDNVTITGNEGEFGAGIANGNGILNMTNSMVTSNSAAFNGGGVYAAGTIHETTITNTTISGNTSGSTNSGAYISTGAGVRVSDGTFNLVDSTVSGNSADTAGTLYDYGGYGGGLFITGQAGYDHSATITNTMILNNNATNGAADSGRGGGIQTAGYSNVILDGTTVDGSTSAAIGGNILFGGSTLEVNNGSVISGGTATRGGGIYAFSGGTVTVTGSTFENNTATLFGGGISVAPGADVTLDETPLTQLVDFHGVVARLLVVPQVVSQTLTLPTVLSSSTTRLLAVVVLSEAFRLEQLVLVIQVSLGSTSISTAAR